MATKFWGQHLIIDAANCKNVDNAEYIKDWAKSLVKEIDMIPYGEPEVIHFGKQDPKLAGNTMLQFIETSNILAHFCDLDGEAYVDVHSCKAFDEKVVLEHFKKWFEPTSMNVKMIYRDARPTLCKTLCKRIVIFFKNIAKKWLTN